MNIEAEIATSIALAVLLATLVAAWVFRQKKKTKSSHKEPPLVEGGIPILGHALEFAKDPAQFLLKCHAKYGGVFQIKLVSKTYVIMDGSHKKMYFGLPEKTLSFDQAIIQAGVATDATVGKITVLNPWHVPIIKRAFSEKNLELYVQRMERQVHKALEQFGIGQEKGVIIQDLKALAWTIVANSSATSFLGEELVEQNPQLAPVFLEFHKACLQVIEASNFLPENMLWLVATAVKKHKQILRQVIIPEVEKRRTSSNKEQQDALTWMIDTGRPAQEIADRFMAFIFSAMITTAGAMTHALNDLAGRPDQWALLLKEQERVQQKYGSTDITQDALQDLHRLQAFIWESIRMGALPMQQTRIAVEEGIELEPGCGVFLPKGAMVAISGVLANTLVEESTKFRPERFLKENGSLLEDAATIGFFPFGIGRHYCPGRHFAVAEIKVALTVLLRNFRFRTVSGQVPQYKSTPADTTRVAEPVEFTRVAM